MGFNPMTIYTTARSSKTMLWKEAHPFTGIPMQKRYFTEQSHLLQHEFPHLQVRASHICSLNRTADQRAWSQKPNVNKQKCAPWRKYFKIAVPHSIRGL